MIRRFGDTPGQLLCNMCNINIKDANTFLNITPVQAIIRHVSFEVIYFPIFFMRRNFFISISLIVV
ncbi:RDD domain protein [Wolbachia endosymbiont of Brugia pahangi]|nr:RDD domain protein [Wolbachia endosymbiont of Brugia pahangi]